nr:putative P protein [Aksy-Durug Melophagus sigmavirus]
MSEQFDPSDLAEVKRNIRLAKPTVKSLRNVETELDEPTPSTSRTARLEFQYPTTAHLRDPENNVQIQTGSDLDSDSTEETLEVKRSSSKLKEKYTFYFSMESLEDIRNSFKDIRRCLENIKCKDVGFCYELSNDYFQMTPKGIFTKEKLTSDLKLFPQNTDVPEQPPQTPIHSTSPGPKHQEVIELFKQPSTANCEKEPGLVHLEQIKRGFTMTVFGYPNSPLQCGSDSKIVKYQDVLEVYNQLDKNTTSFKEFLYSYYRVKSIFNQMTKRYNHNNIKLN